MLAAVRRPPSVAVIAVPSCGNVAAPSDRGFRRPVSSSRCLVPDAFAIQLTSIAKADAVGFSDWPPSSRCLVLDSSTILIFHRRKAEAVAPHGWAHAGTYLYFTILDALRPQLSVLARRRAVRVLPANK